MSTPSSPEPLRPVTAEERGTYDRDGVVHLRRIYPPEWVDHLANQLADVFDGHRSRATDQRSVDGDPLERAERFPIVWPRPESRNSAS